MDAAATPQPMFTKAELELVVELLVRERSELPAEIHHTRTSEVRDQLRQRLGTVERLLQRLGAGAAG